MHLVNVFDCNLLHSLPINKNRQKVFFQYKFSDKTERTKYFNNFYKLEQHVRLLLRQRLTDERIRQILPDLDPTETVRFIDQNLHKPVLHELRKLHRRSLSA